MNKKLPLVSVIMPVHNAGRFLVPAIESILKQTYPRIEFLIVDDASTDGSWDTIKNYRKRYKKIIRVFRISKQTNAAGNGAMNVGLTYAHGEFIARMDADDVAVPKRIEKQAAYLLAHPDIILAGSQATIIDKRGKKIGIKAVPTQHEAIYQQYGILHPVIHPSVMLRRSLLPDPNKIYAMKWSVNDDYYTFFKLLNYGKFANLPESLLKYRMHGANLSLLKPKERFLTSVWIRTDAVTHLNYRMSVWALMLLLVQLAVVPLIPERLIVPAYMLIRGMRTPSIVHRAISKLRIFFTSSKQPTPLVYARN